MPRHNYMRFPRNIKDPEFDDYESVMQRHRRRKGVKETKLQTSLDFAHRELKKVSVEAMRLLLTTPRLRSQAKPDQTGQACHFFCVRSRTMRKGKIVKIMKKVKVTYVVVADEEGVEHPSTMRGIFAI